MARNETALRVYRADHRWFGGIGLELAKELAARTDHDLVLVARSAMTLEAAAGQIEGNTASRPGLRCRPHSPDRAASDLRSFCRNENITIDFLVNNAGFGLGGEFADTIIQRELDMIQVNICGAHAPHQAVSCLR